MDGTSLPGGESPANPAPAHPHSPSAWIGVTLGTWGHLPSPPLDVSIGTAMPAARSTVSFMELYDRSCCSTGSGTGQSPPRCLLEGHLGDNQNLGSSAFGLGTENSKAIWLASKSIPNTGLALWRCTCEAVLRTVCFKENSLKSTSVCCVSICCQQHEMLTLFSYKVALGEV